MNCPVCKTAINDLEVICPVCGFFDLHKEFVNVSDATKWYEELVIPYRERWLHSTKQVDPNKLYHEMMSNILSNTRRVDINDNDHCDFEYCIENGGVILTKYLSYGMNNALTIPTYIKGLPVVELGNGLFKGCRELKKIVLSQTVHTIGNRAFDSSGVESVDIPFGVIHIGENAFSNSRLKEISLPDSLLTIGTGAFRGTSISTIVFPTSVKDIVDDVCYSCQNLHTVIIRGASRLSTFAFGQCRKLSKLALPETLVEIYGDSQNVIGECFELCAGAHLVLPKSLKTIAIGSHLPAKSIVVLNDQLQWFTRKPLNASSNILDGRPFCDMDTYVNNPFDDLFVGFSSDPPYTYTLFCNAGSSTHSIARKRGYSVKRISEFDVSKI